MTGRKGKLCREKVNMKRLLLFSVNSDIYEESGYVIYLLSELMRHCDKAIICTSRNIEEKLYTKLQEYSETILQYGDYIDINRWIDAWYTKVYKHAILEDIDEVLFANDSVFGPIYSLGEVFDDFDGRQVDFWGMSVHGKMKYGTGEEELSRFIQTYFWAVRRNMFLSDEFHAFMRTRRHYTDYDTASREFEFIFTNNFEKQGYKWDTYVDTAEYENQNSEHFISFILFDLYDLVVKHRYPFIPKVIFDIPVSTMQTYNMGDDLYRTLEYVRTHTNYSMEFFYSNIIKRINLSDLICKLKLTYILHTDIPAPACNIEKRYAIFAHLFYEDLFVYSVEKILNVPDFFDIYISTSSSEKAGRIEEIFQKLKKEKDTRQIQITVFNERGRDLSSLLVCHREKILGYDIIGFIHDKKSSQMDYVTVGENFNRNIWENMLNTTGYIYRIMELLDRDEHLGFLSVPMVYHGTYFHTAIDSWTICFDKTAELAERLGIKINIDRSKNPVALGSAFWCKTKALEKLFLHEFLPQDFPEEPMPVDGTISHAIERILPYVAQAEGYYTGVIMTDEAASFRIGVYNDLLSDILKEVNQFAGINVATSELAILSLRSSKIKKKPEFRLKEARKILRRERKTENESGR